MTGAAPQAHDSAAAEADVPFAIRVRDVGKRYELYERPSDRLLQSLYRGRRAFYTEFWALRDISFDVRRGETVGIIGANGSGKSTLLQIIAGTQSTTTGSVDVDGRIAALLELGSGFNPEFTGRENVFVNGAILGLAHRQLESRFDDIVAFAGLAEFIDRPIKTYSSGMVMRLAFSVAVNVEPDVLIIDEALAVGDSAFQLQCIARLEELTRSGVTLLFVSHDSGLVKTFCQRAIYLDRGRMVAEGTPDVVTEMYALDIQRAQAAPVGKSVVPKPSVNADGGIAFGTDEGRIVSARFASTGTSYAATLDGRDLAFDVDVEVVPDVAHPCISVLVLDRQARVIGGAYVHVPPRPEERPRVTMRCALRARLGAGAYSITLRLENRRSSNVSRSIDKQVRALVFEVVQPDRDAYLGMVDLGITGVAIETSQAMPSPSAAASRP